MTCRQHSGEGGEGGSSRTLLQISNKCAPSNISGRDVWDWMDITRWGEVQSTFKVLIISYQMMLIKMVELLMILTLI